MLPKILPGLLVFLPVAFAPGFAEPARENLPAGVIPLHYDLALVPDAEKLTFRGQVLITIDVKATAPAIVLNAEELVLDKALIDESGRPAAVAYDTKLQRATLLHPLGERLGWDARPSEDANAPCCSTECWWRWASSGTSK